MQQQKRSFSYAIIVRLIFGVMIYLAYEAQHSTTKSTTTTPNPPLSTHQQNEQAVAIATKYLDKRFIQRLSKSFDDCIWPKYNFSIKQYFSFFTKITRDSMVATIVRRIDAFIDIPALCKEYLYICLHCFVHPLKRIY